MPLKERLKSEEWEIITLKSNNSQQETTYFSYQQHKKFIDKINHQIKNIKRQSTFQTSFIDLTQVKLVEDIFRKNQIVDYKIDGGFINPYLFCIFCNTKASPLIVIEAIQPKGEILTHSQIMGFLLNQLKLPFDAFGDIYVTDKKIYLAILQIYEAWFINCEVFIKNKSLNFVKTDERVEIIYQFKQVKINLKSLRLDAFIAVLASKSREKAQNLLKEGQISVNFAITNTKTMLIEYGMIVSIRKVGRFKIETIEKKGSTYQIVVNQFI